MVEKNTPSRIGFNILNYGCMLLFAVVCFLPFWHVLMCSISEPRLLMANSGLVLWPLGKPTLDGYKMVLQNKDIWSGYGNTFVYVFSTALLGTFMTALAGFLISRKNFKLTKPLTIFIVFTMIFSAGTIPTYLIVKATGILNTLWALILPSLVAVYNFIVMKAFFEGLPNDLFESARIDGAGEFKILFSIVLPLSLPIVTTISLYYAVAHWNVYTAAILYIQDTKLMPLQVILRRMINSASTGDLNIDDEIPPETLRMAAVCIATAPIVIIYPFIQKYFVKGTLAGAVKG